jgi:hypothetical protein
LHCADACRAAGALLLRAGFECRHRSLKSEACYYAWPGRTGLLRVAAHASRTDAIDGAPIIARLTFTYASPGSRQRQVLDLTPDQLEAATAAAIGRFMIASAIGRFMITPAAAD